MTASDGATTSPQDTLTLDVDLPHPPAKVWRALTEPALLAEWLLPVLDLRLEPGAEFTFTTQPYPGWDGTVHCRMLEIEPHRTLRYTWGVPFLETVVTFTLTPTASGTRLSIVQSGFGPQQKREFGGARYGWTMMSGRLADLLARIA
jgi:uncharacterized protein YndB with AHSA1/START domain